MKMEEMLVILILPSILVLAGIFMGIAGRPKRYRWWIGYRTPKACKTQETWVFANTFSGKMMLVIGLVALTFFIGIVIHGYEVFELLLWGIGASFLGIILTIIFTEVEMSKRFDKNGIRKQQDEE
jgi:uncharacterized membrane protein